MKALGWLVSGFLIVAAGTVVAFGLLAGLQACTKPDPLAPLAATACAEQRAVAFETVDACRAQVPPLQTRIAAVEQTVVPLETIAAGCQQATATPTPLYPTPIATPTPPPVIGMCQRCTEGGRECPVGYSCANCYDLGWRCVDPSSILGSCNQCRIAGIALEFPTLTGLAVHYTDVDTASGESFCANAMTCSVDFTLWPALQGLTLRVTRLDTSTSIDVYANDWGYLYKAGWWAWDVRPVGKWQVARYWPAQPGIGYQMVIDLPEGTAAAFAPDTCLVSVEVLR